MKLWTAASSNDPMLTQDIIDEVYDYANVTCSAVPFPDLHDPDLHDPDLQDPDSSFNGFAARPAVGGAFARLTLTLAPRR